MKILAPLLCTALLGSACSAPHGMVRTSRPVEKVTTLKVIPLRYASASQVSVALRGMLKDVRIVPDERTNSLVVSYEKAADLAQIEQCVAQLDVEVK